jgi:hypothetical protein
MALHHDLLDQAAHLARKEPKRPKQASLRRAVSAAYYGLFHLLVDAAVKQFVRGQNPWDLQNVLRRAFDHSEMKSMSRAFSGGTLPAGFASALAGPVPPELWSTSNGRAGPNACTRRTRVLCISCTGFVGGLVPVPGSPEIPDVQADGARIVRPVNVGTREVRSAGS